jgi:2-succinyl-5-enolpyruvyl-6-hydroxy-3-cyclohexene-1-carboxylate synthase
MKDANDLVSLCLAKALVRQLVESGVTHLVASPGYRNSPLLLAAHKEKELKVITAVDERGAAFCALGMAKALGRPAAVICTSGTAVANYFPAVMEAGEAGVPLVVITADRPLELIGTGANQCTDQIKVFGNHVRHFAEVNAPTESFPGEEHARYAVGRAVARALEPSPGPVHLNVRFREPFLPDSASQENITPAPRAAHAHWKFMSAASGPSKEQWDALELLFSAAQRPAMILGATSFPLAFLKKIAHFSKKSGIPVLAESASGLAYCGEEVPFLCPRPELILGAMADGKLEAPDLLFRIGPPLTGRGLGRLLKSYSIPQVALDQWGYFQEPHLYPSILMEGGMDGWLDAFGRSNIQILDGAWRRRLLEAEQGIESRLQAALSDSTLTEWLFHRQLQDKLLDDSLLFLGNSMPIRDFNSAFPLHPQSPKRLRVLSNRGLSGIDGLIASAAGAALVHGKQAHVVLGDLSTLHDVSSLSLLSSLRDTLQLTLWVMNNDGGEIFRMVQTARAGGDPHWFTTPVPYDLSALAKAFYLSYGILRSRNDLEETPPDAVNGPGVRIIEVLVDREPSLALRQNFRPFA